MNANFIALMWCLTMLMAAAIALHVALFICIVAGLAVAFFIAGVMLS